MATSGTTTWQLTVSQIIDAALRKVAALSSGTSATAANQADAMVALNAMLKTFQTKGMPLWAIKETSFPLTATRTYTIGVGQTINVPAPLKIIQAYNKNVASGSSVPMNIRTRFDYNQMQPVSTTTGYPIDLEYEPGNQTGTIRIWPLPDSSSISNNQITIVYQRPFEDAVALTDNIDFPQFWHEAIIYGLASRLSPEYGVPLQDRTILKAEALEYLKEALEFGTEEGSMFIQPNWQG